MPSRLANKSTRKLPAFPSKAKYARGLFLLLLFFSSPLQAVSSSLLKKLAEQPHPFRYDLHTSVLPGKSTNQDLMIAMHGMGSDYRLGQIMRSNSIIPYHIVSFNFPDYGSLSEQAHPSTFGTFEEIAPALFILKKFIVDGNIDKVHLYGFSAGGGALVNILSILNTHKYANELQKLGIGESERNRILSAVQKGTLILEVPLKSFDEIACKYHEVGDLARRARSNGLVPIDNLKGLQGLALNVFLYFNNPDHALGNRDDQKYIQLLQKANQKGKTVALIGNSGGHIAYHTDLWSAYRNYINN